MEIDGEVVDLDLFLLPDLVGELDQLQGQGFRVLAVAYKEVATDRSIFSKDDEC